MLFLCSERCIAFLLFFVKILIFFKSCLIIINEEFYYKLISAIFIVCFSFTKYSFFTQMFYDFF